jgi:hypothetical protein
VIRDTETLAMSVLRHTKSTITRPPRKPRGVPGDPLERLLRRAVRQAEDPAVRAWLRGLLRGEAADGRTGETK